MTSFFLHLNIDHIARTLQSKIACTSGYLLNIFFMHVKTSLYIHKCNFTNS